MNKQKGIIIGVLALVVTMMVGYALFSETITINGTATAKGDFDMTITCSKGIDTTVSSLDAINNSSLGYTLPAEGGYENDVCSVSDDANAMTFSVNFKYPGAARYFTAKITNNGSIDAAFNLETGIGTEGKACLDTNEDEAFTGTECETDNHGFTPELYGLQKSDGTIIDPYDSGLSEQDIAEFTNGKKDGTIILKPGYSAYFLLMAGVNNQIGTNNGGKLFMKVETTHTFNFVQSN